MQHYIVQHEKSSTSNSGSIIKIVEHNIVLYYHSTALNSGAVSSATLNSATLKNRTFNIK